MNTMFYHFIFLLDTMQTTKRRMEQLISDATIQLSDIKKSYTTEKYIKEYYKKLKVSNENNVKYKNIYDSIVKEFVKKFIKDFYVLDDKIYKKSEYQLEINIPENYDSYYIKNFCDEKKKSLIKKIYNVNAIDEFDFECAYNLFVEFAQFAMDTMKTVHDNRIDCYDYIESSEFTIRNTKLLENLIISVNWFNQLIPIQFEFSLLHNYKEISAIDCNDPKNRSLCITYVFSDEYEKSTTHKNILTESLEMYFRHNITNKKENNIDIYQSEYREKIEKFLDERIVKGMVTKKIAEIATRDCVMLRCYATKIKYLAKSRYYKDINRTKTKVIHSHALMIFRKLMGAMLLYKDVFAMKFDMHHTYSLHSMVCIFTLISFNDIKIEYLSEFLEHLIILMNNYYKKKYETTLNEYFDNLIAKCNNIDKITDLEKEKLAYLKQINDIKSPTLSELEASTFEKYELIEKKYTELAYIWSKVGITEANHESNHDKRVCDPIKQKDYEFLKLKSAINKFINIMKNMTILQKKIGKKFNKIKDEKGNTLKNMLKMPTENKAENQSITIKILRILSKIYIKENSMAEDLIIRFNTHIASNAQLKELIEDKKIKINVIITDTIELKCLIIEAEKKAIELIELYKKIC